MNRLVIMSGGADVGGCGISLKRSFDRHAPGWEARAICRTETYLKYPTDILWEPLDRTTRSQVISLVRQADVLHLMDSERPLRDFAPYLSGKKVVVHHLGTHFRRNPVAMSRICARYGATQVTDSIDLVRPEVSFEPVPADFDALSRLREEHFQPSERIRIAHAPTRRAVKSTRTIVDAVERLQRRYPIDFDLIERVGHRECLERKARADIFIDQLMLGFGMNAIECWAMGIPVVSGLIDRQARERAFGMWGGLPWEDATAETLEAVIERLVVDAGYRAEAGQRGTAHGLAWHSEAAVVDRMLAVYGMTGAQVA